VDGDPFPISCLTRAEAGWKDRESDAPCAWHIVTIWPCCHLALLSHDSLSQAKDMAVSMHATRAAVEEGILPGGGVALLRAGKALDKLKGENEDQRHGVEMVKKGALLTGATDRECRRGRIGSSRQDPGQ
jgi:hypothetical protein